MDEDSLSRDCEPFFESDGEEESTDGKFSPRPPCGCFRRGPPDDGGSLESRSRSANGSLPLVMSRGAFGMADHAHNCVAV